jgi:hypothetical protein
VATSNGSLSQGLVGWWTFDGKDVVGVTAYDRSGQGNNGALAGSPTRTIGKIGQALQFTAASDLVSIGSPASLDNIDNKTISAWIYPRGGPAGGESAIIADKRQGGATGWYFALCNPSGDASNCGGAANALFYAHDLTTDGNWTSPANSITLNTWQHVLVTYASSTAAVVPIFYINGVRQTTTETFTPAGTPEDDSSVSLSFGSANTALQFNGVIDDIRIYNRILSADEIKRLYLMGR